MRKLSFFTLLFIITIISYAQIIKTPYIASFKNLEDRYALISKKNTQDYLIEQIFYLSSKKYNSGIAYFLPNYLKRASITISSFLIDFQQIDGYIAKLSNLPIDIANPVDAFECFHLNHQPYGDKCLINYLSNDKVLLYPSTSSLRFYTEIFTNIQNHWIYAYPKTKREYIGKNGVVFAHPIGTTFNYLFDKEKIDTFVQHNPNKITPYQKKCSNTRTYFKDIIFDRFIHKIAPIMQKNNLPIKKASQFKDFEKIKSYVNTIKETLSNENNSTLSHTLQSLSYFLNETEYRKETTKNLCLYLNYVIDTPQYQSLHQITIINSQGHPGSIEDLYKFLKKINGYMIDGYFVQYNNKSYFIDYSANIYNITKECKARNKNKITSSQIKNLILKKLQNQPKSYIIFMDDWDNDANDTLDCLKYEKSTNTLAKADMDNQDNLFFINLDPNQIGQIKYTSKVIYFDRSISQNSSSLSQENMSSSASSATASSTSNSMSQNNEEEENEFPTGEDSGGYKEVTNFNETSSSSSLSMANSSSSFSCNETNSTIINIINELKNRSLNINGYFAYYGNSNHYDPYAWVYFSKDGNVFAKLNGMDPNTGKLQWIFLKLKSKNININYFQNIHLENDKIIIGQAKQNPSNEANSTIQNIVNDLQNRSLDITGYFAYYGNSNHYDPYAWVYFSKDGNVFAKLNGMDPKTGKLKWIYLKRKSKNINYFQNIHLENDKIIIGQACIPNTK